MPVETPAPVDDSTMPTISTVPSPTARVPPTARLAPLAYAESRSATLAAASSAVRARPSTTDTVVSGPTAAEVGSMPSTLKRSTSKALPPAPSAPPVAPWPGCGGPWLKSGSSPEKVVFSSASVPAAAATCLTSAAWASAAASNVAVPGVVDSRDRLTWREPSSEAVPASAPNSKRPGPRVPGGAVWLTVMSVPTPYTDSRTSAWASRTPAEIELTRMTSEIARASPKTTMRV